MDKHIPYAEAFCDGVHHGGELTHGYKLVVSLGYATRSTESTRPKRL
jgi:hypothetical protein